MIEKLKKSFIAGLLVLLPLWVSIALIQWFFGEIDSLFAPILEGSLRRIFPEMPRIPGTGILTGLVLLLALGVLARNVVGKRIFDALERLINRIPGYRLVYSTIKQLTSAFSSENQASFKEVMLVEHPKEGIYSVGFRTMTVEHEGRKLAVVYIPTNHLYLGDVFFVPEEKAVRLDLTIDQAIRLLMSAGIACPRQLHSSPDGTRGMPVAPDA